VAIRPIILHPDPRLKRPADPIGTPDAGIRRLADDMLRTMYDAPGIGLAAPQVGEGVRLLVMDCVKEEGAPPRPMALVDPQIVRASEERSVYEEGCLSIPEHYAEVERPESVTVRWTDLDGAPQEETFDGLWATCLQHEMDHLDGVLFIDHLTLLKRQMITRKMLKLKRERARA
jgi:peptide deformylase